MRLSLARQRLLQGQDEATVTGIALASGFSQLGRFSLHYRKLFGELPSETLRGAQRKEDGIDDEAVRLALRALESAHAVAPKQCDAALEDLTRAQKIAPGYQLPKALEAWCLGQRAAQHFSTTPIEDTALARKLAEEASAKAPNDVMVLTHCSGALALAHRIEEADKLAERALALDPWSALGWYRRGWLSAYLGDAEGALRELNSALHIMPFWPLKHTAFIGIGCAHFAAGNYDRALRWVQSGVEASSASFWAERVVVASAVHAGARAEARRIARELMRKDPELTVSVARRAWPFPPDFMARLADGLATAGVPRR
jgi:tetratricopeptide (TPR) repeat protein